MTMKLSQLLAEHWSHPHQFDPLVTGLSLDSRTIKAGEVFFALKGLHDHGLKFTSAAVSNGCCAVVWESDTDAPIAALNGLKIPVIEVTDLSAKLGAMASRFYCNPSCSLDIVGITGTNGKTSTARLIAAALDSLGQCAGTVGTLGYGMVGQETALRHTTPSAIELQKVLSHLSLAGAEWVAMEVSSHALVQGRVNGVRFKAAVFTNLSRDHLDYHGDMQSYAAAKARLMAAAGLEFAILNAEDPVSAQMRAAVKAGVEVLTYGIGQGDICAEEVVLDRHGISCNLSTPWGTAPLRSKLMARFNLLNLLAVVSLLGAYGWPLEKITTSIADIEPVPGRMNLFSAAGRPLVVVDYSHTPDALEQALKAIRSHGFDDVVCVFGCGGDRDRGKRPEMGEIAARLAEHLVLTDDNPRTEDGDQIVADILAGITHRGNVQVIRDRKQAIRSAIGQAHPDSAVLIAGKGHEDYQEINGQRVHLDDREEVRMALELSS